MEQGTFLSAGTTGLDCLTPRAIARALNERPRQAGRSDAATSRRLGPESAPTPVPNPTGGRPAAAQPLVPAAVLVPLVEHDDGLTVLLTKRTAHLHHHGGQISFPGGRIEPADPDPTAAALRETCEEIGLPAERVEILGRLDDYVTGTGFRIAPVVGLVHPPLALVPDAFEVEDIFEVPLAFILDPANHQRHSRVTAEGITRYFHAIPFGERFIWGATAAMLVNLYEALRRCCAS